MRGQTSSIVIAFLVAAAAVAMATGVAAEAPTPREVAIENGLERGPAPAAVEAGERQVELGVGQDFLLVPDRTNARVMAFDPTTGDLVDANFIPADTDHLDRVKNVILKPGGTGFLASHQLDDVVYEFDLAGAYVGVFAPAGGANTAIMDNIRTVQRHPVSGNILVTSDGGTNENAVVEFDTAGTYLGTLVATGAGGLDGPWDILIGADMKVSASNSASIHAYDATTGAPTGIFASANYWLQGMAYASNGNVLVANWSGTQEGVLEYQADGTFVALYTSGIDQPRGVFELPNGNLLVSDTQGVHEISRTTGLVESKITGVNCEYITLVEGVVPVELQSFSIN